MPKKRLKTRALTLYVDPKYNDKITFLKYTCGLTRFVERCLENVQVDEAVMCSIKKIENVKKTS